MAAKEAYYFSHDSNAHNDTKILSMICDYGMEGYGRYWVIVESLREQSNYKLTHDKSTWKALAMQMQCTPDAVKKFIEDCIYEYALFDISEDMEFYSNSLLRRMNKYHEIKQIKKEAAEARWNKQKKCTADAESMHMHSTTNTDVVQNDANEIKLNEINNIGDKPHTKFIPPTLEEVKQYCAERNKGVNAEKWINFYESKGWMVGKNKMKDWKAAVRTWEPEKTEVTPFKRPESKIIRAPEEFLIANGIK